MIRSLFSALFKTRKVAGLRVTPAVHGLVQQGNRARDGRRWDEAAEAFAAALQADPTLHPIRLQRANMLKEAGVLDAADAAYADAIQYLPDDAEPLVQRAHLATLGHAPRQATRYLIAGLYCGRASDRAESELRRMLDLEPALSSSALKVLVSEAKPEEVCTPEGASTPGQARPIVFDITDLIGHYRYQRAPTGIQRVEIEALKGDGHDGVPPRLGCFLSGYRDMLPVPPDLAMPLIALSLSGSDTDDAEWQEARARLFLQLALSPPMAMPDRAILINLGTSLWVKDYFLFIRNAKARHAISYVPFVHDLIPIMVPEHCIREIKEDFAAWVAGVFHHADGFLVNSHSTARDLAHAADLLGMTVEAGQIEVVPLNADFRSVRQPLPEGALARWGLEVGGYALLVSTVEPRKNHLLALEAWSALIRAHGPDRVPRLVCVGRSGWLNDHVFARLAADPALMAAVTMISGVSDAELALLYQHCRFTLYPSHYEGWGLPITEALCYGKLPVIADNSSLPEAGAGFALSFASGSVPALVDALTRTLFDAEERRAQERRIADDYRPRPWPEIARQIATAAQRMSAESTLPAPAGPVRTGAFHPVALHRAPEIWAGLVNGEIYRIGDGWLWPEPDGCRTRPEGGALRLRVVQADGVTPASEAVRIYVQLRGLASADCPVTITVDDRAFAGVAPVGDTVWIACDVPAAVPWTTLFVQGERAEEVLTNIGYRKAMRAASVAVVGLLVGAGDEAASARAMASIDAWRR